jgi:hypothetical protein
MDLTTLKPWKRYLFRLRNKRGTRLFRASFVRVILNQIQVYLYEDADTKINNYTIYTMPAYWIKNAEDLIDILQNKCVLPDDVVAEIDSYL